MHAVIIFITLTLFGFTVYATGSVLGSPERMYTNLQYMAQVCCLFMLFDCTHGLNESLKCRSHASLQVSVSVLDCQRYSASNDETLILELLINCAL